jgi:hypothetical protein
MVNTQTQAQSQTGGGESHVAMDVDPLSWLNADLQWSPPSGGNELLGMSWPAMPGALGTYAEEIS